MLSLQYFRQALCVSFILSALLVPGDAWTTLPQPVVWRSGSLARSASTTATTTKTTRVGLAATVAPEQVAEYEIPEDAVITIKPNAFRRLQELRQQQKLSEEEPLVLRMGVRSGGCSGMSYVMDIAKEGDIVSEDDAVDEYPGVQCVVDSKSMLYLYGLELDYSDELVGGGFKFINRKICRGDFLCLLTKVQSLTSLICCYFVVVSQRGRILWLWKLIWCVKEGNEGTFILS